MSGRESPREFRRFVVVTLDVPVGGETNQFGRDDDEAIAGALSDDLRDAGWEVLGVSVYGLGGGKDA